MGGLANCGGVYTKATNTVAAGSTCNAPANFTGGVRHLN